MCLYIKYVTQCKITEVYHDLLVLYQDHLPWMHQDLKIVGTCSHSKLKFFWRKEVVFLVWKLCPGENYFYTIFLSHALAKTRLRSVHESIYIMELQCTFPMVLNVMLFILHQGLVFFFFNHYPYWHDVTVWSITYNTLLHVIFSLVLLIKFFIATHHFKHIVQLSNDWFLKPFYI